MKFHRNLAVCIAAVAGSTLLVSGVQADPTTLNAFEDQEVRTNFTLDFPSLGITRTSKVFFTRFKLELDEEAGTARFLEYNQEIDSLDLRLGINTGPIQVRILESRGAYDPDTRTFETQDVYEILFTNDLTSFGFESPVILPAVSSGTVTGGVANAQRVEMQWEGGGEFENASNPAEPFLFKYVSRISTIIAASEADVPALPTRDTCGTGLFSLFGFLTMSLMFVGMKANVRRRRR